MYIMYMIGNKTLVLHQISCMYSITTRHFSNDTINTEDET